MRLGKVEIKENTIVIKGENSPWYYRFLLYFLFMASVFLANKLFLNFLDTSQLRLFFPIVLLLLLSFYALQFLLWHSFGKEVLVLFDDKIDYYADYKLFKSRKKELLISDKHDTFGIRINVWETPIEEVDMGIQDEVEVTPTFNEDHHVIETRLTISAEDMGRIENLFLERYNDVFN